MCFHKAGIDFNGLFEGLYSTVELAGFSTRHADDDMGFLVVGVDGQCSFGREHRITEMTLVKMKQTNVVPAIGEVRFESHGVRVRLDGFGDICATCRSCTQCSRKVSYLGDSVPRRV